MRDGHHTDSADDYRPTPLEWMQTIRRANIPTERKAACLIIATYANVGDDPDNGKRLGEGIHPGVDRLATDLRRSVATARRHLEWMRDVGLIVLVRRGNRRRQQSDEYRLALSAEAMERASIPDPEAYKELIGNAKRTDRQRHKARRDQRSQDDGADPITAQQVSGKEPITAQSGTGLPLTKDERPPRHEYTNHDSLTDHEVADPRTDLAVPRARGQEQEISPDGEQTDPTPDGAERSPLTTDQPQRQPARTGLGFCVTCYAAGQFTIAADPEAGSHCATHLGGLPLTNAT